jgi:hypothetical protein
MLVILLIIFFIILLLYQLYFYFYPIREGIDDSSCINLQLSNFDKRITALETQVNNFKLNEIETTLVDLCGNVLTLMEQSKAKYTDLQNQAQNPINNDTSDDTTNVLSN